MSDQAIYFGSPSEWRRWLAENHVSEKEVLVGYYKKGVDKPTITWPQSVDEALCYGWIDGVRRTVDNERYTIRFTPRKSTSIWSAVNMNRVAELTEQGLMQPEGLTAFEKRKQGKSVIYSYEQKGDVVLADVYLKPFQANEKAWGFFDKQAGWYKKAAIWRIVSAKKEDTRLKRLEELIQDSENQRTIKTLTR